MKVYLGGTCNDSLWREQLSDMLTNERRICLFNPVVNDWNATAQAREKRERLESNFVLYTITPKMTGVYSIAEVVDDSNKRPEKTIFCVLSEDDGKVFLKGQRGSLDATAKMVTENGGQYFSTLGGVVKFLLHQTS